MKQVVKLAVVAAIAVAAVVLAVTDPFRGPARAASNPYPFATAVVTRGSLTAQSDVDGTVADAGSYTLVNEATGEYTALPTAGQVVRQGQVLYQVSGNPVVLLDGSVPSYRDLSAGMSGADVAELNHDLVALGYCDRGEVAAAGWDYFGADTGYGLQALQQRLGLPSTGSLALGQAVFVPVAAIEVAALGSGAIAGGAAMPEQAVLTASSTIPVVTIELDPGLQTYVKDGDQVSVTLPDGAVTPGTVTNIGAAVSSSSESSGAGSAGGGSAGGSSSSGVASSSSSPGGSSSSPERVTIPVQVTLVDPGTATGLDQAPVSVTITTGSVSGVLIVPVAALLAQAEGEGERAGYAVEVIGPAGRHRVPVSTGLFDDAMGLVQVTGAGLAAGQRVVVPGV